MDRAVKVVGQLALELLLWLIEPTVGPLDWVFGEH